jgi:hypothetical protein
LAYDTFKVGGMVSQEASLASLRRRPLGPPLAAWPRKPESIGPLGAMVR